MTDRSASLQNADTGYNAKQAMRTDTCSDARLDDGPANNQAACLDDGLDDGPANNQTARVDDDAHLQAHMRPDVDAPLLLRVAPSGSQETNTTGNPEEQSINCKEFITKHLPRIALYTIHGLLLGLIPTFVLFIIILELVYGGEPYGSNTNKGRYEHNGSNFMWFLCIVLSTAWACNWLRYKDNNDTAVPLHNFILCDSEYNFKPIASFKQIFGIGSLKNCIAWSPAFFRNILMYVVICIGIAFVEATIIESLTLGKTALLLCLFSFSAQINSMFTPKDQTCEQAVSMTFKGVLWVLFILFCSAEAQAQFKYQTVPGIEANGRQCQTGMDTNIEATSIVCGILLFIAFCWFVFELYRLGENKTPQDTRCNCSRTQRFNDLLQAKLDNYIIWTQWLMFLLFLVCNVDYMANFEDDAAECKHGLGEFATKQEFPNDTIENIVKTCCYHMYNRPSFTQSQRSAPFTVALFLLYVLFCAVTMFYVIKDAWSSTVEAHTDNNQRHELE